AAAAAVGLALAGALAAPSPAAAFDCKVALVLALDVSSSVDAQERRLQAEGLAAAFLHPEIQEAILRPEGTGITAMVFTWSGVYDQQIHAPWMKIDSEGALRAFAGQVAGAQSYVWERPTALGRALSFAARQHAANPTECRRKVIDVSGDGVSNEGVDPAHTRGRGLLDGIVVNALVIRGDTPDPLPYYLKEVIQGPGSFALNVQSYDDYADGIRRKLLLELTDALAEAPPQSLTLADAALHARGAARRGLGAALPLPRGAAPGGG
ncbi:MAG: DUF1194 domain-containing protein, partial [Pseudomonadota bacterium]